MDIGKRFAKHPTSTRTSLGRSVVFVCEAPEGRPIPVIYWLKNGERLGGSAPDQLREINHTMQDSPSHHSEVSSIDRGVSKIDDRSEQEHNASSRLTIPAVQLGHEGTYVCVAENQAGRRFSHPAHLTIHADGAWSTWSAWSECPPECSPNKQYRKFDEQQQPVGNRFQFCPLFCQKFHSQRWRECNTPKPRGGGRACPGDLTQIASCLEICKKNVFDSPSDTHNSQMSAAEVTLLVGLVIAILIFLGAASVVVYVLTNRWSRNGFHFEKNESLVTCCPIVRLPKFTKPRHLQQPRSAEPPSTFCELKSNSLAQSELSLKTYRFNKRRMSDMNQPCQVIHLSDFANNNVRHAQGCHSDPDWRNSVPPAGYYYCEPKNLWPTAPGQNSQSQFPARSNIFMMYTPQNHPLCANPTNVIYSLPVPAPPREFDNGYGLGKPIESQSYVYIKNPLCESDVPKNAIAGEFSSW
ncbi:unnamed protein product [Calicophoron daubneyi]|uniref:Ig-like domain-containing protein n=1 Tax=Calicophoron daubneyi TaxID=300641 RepID=A0AAV2TV63_CALDB